MPGGRLYHQPGVVVAHYLYGYRVNAFDAGLSKRERGEGETLKGYRAT